MTYGCGCGTDAGCNQCGAGQGAEACGHCCGEGCQCSCHGGEECCEGQGMKVFRKAFKKMLVSRVRDRLEKRYGKKMDKLADEMMATFDKWMKMKKDMMEMEEFDLEEKMMEILKG
jgi:hypothetical protein